MIEGMIIMLPGNVFYSTYRDSNNYCEGYYQMILHLVSYFI